MTQIKSSVGGSKDATDVKSCETKMKSISSRFLSISQAGGFLPSQDEPPMNEASGTPQRNGTANNIFIGTL